MRPPKSAPVTFRQGPRTQLSCIELLKIFRHTSANGPTPTIPRQLEQGTGWGPVRPPTVATALFSGPPPEVPVKQKIPGLGAGNPASLLSLLEPPAVPVLFLQHLTDGELTFLRVPSSS